MPREPLCVEPISLDLAHNDPKENLARIESALSERQGVGAPRGAASLRRRSRGQASEVRRTPSPAPDAAASFEERLFLFPELTLTGFVTKNPSSFDLNGSDPLVEALFNLARRYRTALAVGLPQRNPADPKRPYNCLALIGPDGRLIASYRKLHLFTLGASPESACYSAGAAPVMASYRGWKLGLSICFDLRFSGLYHAYAKGGADLLLAPACWVGGPHKSYQFKTLGSAHAILSQAYLACVNRSGRDPAFEYDGSRYVFSPYGEDLFTGGPCRLDPAELDACRRLVVRPADRDSYAVQGA